ncbi:hypothetical protein A2Z22_01260 [Candidatus Woesebacteria bacterium RBG_16_34_12]|uniref:Uncharacterized protein n=1 Tax=Candidatus Woesebacteria bacterium RBG_16_34_12 TaxID=1802480 RepID=A0A1F7X8P8_9BACT|nr:MAG: hypothetical protein A2Z22_01260 [Candidatus Woesebacteria bacterium RBG_16_34_12]
MESEPKSLGKVLTKRTTVISPPDSEGNRNVLYIQADPATVITGYINGETGRFEIPDLDREKLERLLEALVGDLEAGIEAGIETDSEAIT